MRMNDAAARGSKAAIAVPANRVRNRPNRGSRGDRPPEPDRDDHKQRRAVECGIDAASATGLSLLATRYDGLAVRHEAAVLVAAVRAWR
ncbi:hypothetical protein [Streptomyces sp. NPDC006170]|uniref:hypothetical protein n=1 Tax=Streptomyces sp. NPDC006170 TaxID=3154469 RepID=UPI0033AE23FC